MAIRSIADELENVEYAPSMNRATHLSLLRRLGKKLRTGEALSDADRIIVAAYVRHLIQSPKALDAIILSNGPKTCARAQAMALHYIAEKTRLGSRKSKAALGEVAKTWGGKDRSLLEAMRPFNQIAKARFERLAMDPRVLIRKLKREAKSIKNWSRSSET